MHFLKEYYNTILKTLLGLVLVILAPNLNNTKKKLDVIENVTRPIDMLGQEEHKRNVVSSLFLLSFLLIHTIISILSTMLEANTKINNVSTTIIMLQ